MSKILFRGKSMQSGEWFYGYYYETEGRHIILFKCTDNHSREAEVDPATVGQFTELVDKNGKEIFEGDVIRIKARFDSADGTVFYNEKTTSFGFNVPVDGLANPFRELGGGWHGVEIIGNAYDNPDLLEAIE
jgi:uncharacterized phage protein (TIGR01671 family)